MRNTVGGSTNNPNDNFITCVYTNHMCTSATMPRSWGSSGSWNIKQTPLRASRQSGRNSCWRLGSLARRKAKSNDSSEEEEEEEEENGFGAGAQEDFVMDVTMCSPCP